MYIFGRGKQLADGVGRRGEKAGRQARDGGAHEAGARICWTGVEPNPMVARERDDR